jgi:hypothetical protein
MSVFREAGGRPRDAELSLREEAACTGYRCRPPFYEHRRNEDGAMNTGKSSTNAEWKI